MCKATLATSCSDCEQKKAIAEEQSKMKYQYVMEFDVGIHSAFFFIVYQTTQWKYIQAGIYITYGNIMEYATLSFCRTIYFK